ncbi:hypothetical protein L6164_010883 [Bauhinia variegata]|uniref:Uncharacterized protein n=1 Tax=Bauhinia variegata TaxID=167791 RepID=A0ACB9P4X2_BAUVA|nr:hypothetical protein L6164_010883 [Bauhinia variegata]
MHCAAKRNGMEVSEVVIACIADLAFKNTEQLGKDLQLLNFPTHRNEHLCTLLRAFSNNLKAKDPQSERKRKNAARQEEKANSQCTCLMHIHHIHISRTGCLERHPNQPGHQKVVKDMYPLQVEPGCELKIYK